jgi:DNA-directed RNA polymerase subunit RPC12/RpoP
MTRRTYLYLCSQCSRTVPMRWEKTYLACKQQGSCHRCALQARPDTPPDVVRWNYHLAFVRDSLTISDGDPRNWAERLKQRAQAHPDRRLIYLRIHAKRLAYYRRLLQQERIAA